MNSIIVIIILLEKCITSRDKILCFYLINKVGKYILRRINHYKNDNIVKYNYNDYSCGRVLIKNDNA